MSRTKIAISCDPTVLAEIDRLVEAQGYTSRSPAIQCAVEAKLARLSRFERECEKLDPAFERAMAEEGLNEGCAQVRRVTPMEGRFVSAVQETLGEWESKEDNEAYVDL